MKSHGILFKAEMVRALLNTKVGVWPAEAIDPNKPFKWQTRRICKLTNNGTFNWSLTHFDEVGAQFDGHRVTEYVKAKYRVRDELYCKETFHAEDKLSVVYRADESGSGPAISDTFSKGWTPSIFMPRWASRITIEVMAVRCERLHEISPEDAKAEGVSWSLVPYEGPKAAYHTLWHSINGADSWDKNPFVWVYEFRRLK